MVTRSTLFKRASWLRLLAYCGCVAGTPLLFPHAEAKPPQQFEKPRELRASDILPAQLLKGPYHTVNERVTSDGYFNNYRIQSQFGDMTVEGLQLLEIRVGEMTALAELDKLSSTTVFQEAAYKSGKNLVLAPVNLVKKTAQTVSDPKKMADTISAVPEGAEKLFSWAYRQAKGAANAVGDAFSSSDIDSSKKREKKGGDDKAGDVLNKGTKLGLDYIGYTKNQREWFRTLKINPYTTNETLRDEVIRVASIETAVGAAFKVVPSVALLGQLSTFNRWYDRAEKLSLYEDPDVIREKNKGALTTLGVPQDTITRFLDNKAYTPWSRRFITASLSAIGPQVSGHSEFILAACEATNEPTALYFVSVAESLENLHSVLPLKKIVASLYLPAAITSQNSLYVPLPVDYLFWTETVAGIFKDFKARANKEGKISSIDIVVRGQLTPLARKNLEKMGAKVSAGHL